MKEFRKIVKQVELLDIRLGRCEAHLVAPDGEPPAELQQMVNVGAAKNAETNELNYVISIRLVGGAAKLATDMPAMLIEAAFGLKYSVQSLDGITEELVMRFGQVNGVFNIWPYWREFVQNMTCRLGLPGLRIPLLKKPFEFTQNQLPSNGALKQDSQKKKRIKR